MKEYIGHKTFEDSRTEPLTPTEAASLIRQGKAMTKETKPTEEAGEVAEWEVTGMKSFLRARGFEWEAALLTRLQREKEELERKVEYGATVVADMTKHGSSLLAVERNRAEAAERELAAVREDARKWKVWMALRKKLWSGNFDQSDRDLWKILTGDMATEEQIDAALQQDTKDRP